MCIASHRIARARVCAEVCGGANRAARSVECDDEAHCDAGVEGMRVLARLLPALPEQRRRPLASLEVTCVGANEDAHSIDPASGAVGIGILAPPESVRDMLLTGDFDAARRAHVEHQRASAERKQKEKRTHRARTILCTRAGTSHRRACVLPRTLTCSRALGGVCSAPPWSARAGHLAAGS